MPISKVSEEPTAIPSRAPARPEGSWPQRVLIGVGLAVGAVLGFGGNFVPVGPAQNLAYSGSSLGIVMGSALFAAWFARQGVSTVAVGFALFTLAEGVVLTSQFALAGSSHGSVSAFAAGTALYAVALPLVSLPPALPAWVRIFGVLPSLPFAAYALLWLLGRSPATSGPLATAGYVLLTVAMIGWVSTVLRAGVAMNRGASDSTR